MKKIQRQSSKNLISCALYTQQKGVALLTILLLVVAIVIVAGSMLARQKIMIREFDVTQRQAKFREAALAGEAFAQQLIAQDSITNQTDSLQDIWAKPLPTYPVEGSNVTVKISDEASRFNINNLYHDNKIDEQSVDYFKALLQSQGLDPKIANAVLDWQDPDSDTTPDGGAEADYYQSLSQSQTTTIANQPIMNVNELLLIKGMDKEKLAKLRPYITAEPFFLPMNVNTINPELLRIIPMIANAQPQNSNKPTNNSTAQNPPSNNQPLSTAPLDAVALTNWANTRQNNMPLASVDKLWELPVFASVSVQQRNAMAKLLDVQSRAFRVNVTVSNEDKQSYFTSQLAKVEVNQNNDTQFTQNNQTVNPSAKPQEAKQIVAFNRQFSAFILDNH